MKYSIHFCFSQLQCLLLRRTDYLPGWGVTSEVSLCSLEYNIGYPDLLALPFLAISFTVLFHS